MSKYREYIESLPESDNEPNEETIEAIEEARAGKYAGTIDISSLEAFLKSIEDC
jgi:hypothetical protein